MPDVRYVCLSDMHFGAETSLLTNLNAEGEIDPLRPSLLLSGLVDCLRDIILKNEDSGKKPTLILNGDIFELALAQDNHAAMTFQRFIELSMLDNDPLFERIVYNPGNHDHHLWETARETQFAEYIKGLPWESAIEPAWHVSRIFKELEESYFLNSLLKRHPRLKDLKIETAYPNFGLLSDDLQKGIVFHHGHLTEELYCLMSTLKTMIFPETKFPETIWDIEGENFAWIDFFWSVLGRSDEVGLGVGRVYEKLQDDAQTKKMIHNLAEGIAEKYGSTGWIADQIETKMIELALGAVGAMERHNPNEDLSESSEAGLSKYISRPLKEHIDKEIGFTAPDFTFVFGHTHKPWEGFRTYENLEKPVLVYNSGGWVVDKVERQERFGGAVILVDEKLDTVSLRMYNENIDGLYSVRAVEAVRPGQESSPFYSRIAQLVDPGAEPWKTFSETVAPEIEIRAENLAKRIEAENLED